MEVNRAAQRDRRVQVRLLPTTKTLEIVGDDAQAPGRRLIEEGPATHARAFAVSLHRDDVDDVLTGSDTRHVDVSIEPLAADDGIAHHARHVGPQIVEPDDGGARIVDLDHEAIHEEVILHPPAERQAVRGSSLGPYDVDRETLEMNLRVQVAHLELTPEQAQAFLSSPEHERERTRAGRDAVQVSFDREDSAPWLGGDLVGGAAHRGLEDGPAVALEHQPVTALDPEQVHLEDDARETRGGIERADGDVPQAARMLCRCDRKGIGDDVLRAVRQREANLDEVRSRHFDGTRIAVDRHFLGEHAARLEHGGAEKRRDAEQLAIHVGGHARRGVARPELAVYRERDGAPARPRARDHVVQARRIDERCHLDAPERDGLSVAEIQDDVVDTDWQVADAPGHDETRFSDPCARKRAHHVVARQVAPRDEDLRPDAKLNAAGRHRPEHPPLDENRGRLTVGREPWDLESIQVMTESSERTQLVRIVPARPGVPREDRRLQVVGDATARLQATEQAQIVAGDVCRAQVNGHQLLAQDRPGLVLEERQRRAIELELRMPSLSERRLLRRAREPLLYVALQLGAERRLASERLRGISGEHRPRIERKGEGPNDRHDGGRHEDEARPHPLCGGLPEHGGRLGPRIHPADDRTISRHEIDRLLRDEREELRAVGGERVRDECVHVCPRSASLEVQKPLVERGELPARIVTPEVGETLRDLV